MTSKAELVICMISGKQQRFYEREIPLADMEKIQQSFFEREYSMVRITPKGDPESSFVFNMSHIETVVIVLKPFKNAEEDK